MNPRLLLCRHCYVWYAVQRAIPDICPNCEKSAMWTTDNNPGKPYLLSENDRRILKALRIACDPEDDAA